jgi:ParG
VSGEEDKTVKLVVFLTDEERTQFKIACARNKISMSQRARELILEWLNSESEAFTPKTKKGEGAA